MNDFEKILAKEIIQSLTNHPELWETSIAGLSRKDGLELYIGMFDSLSNISVFNPYKYDFKEIKFKQEVYTVAKNLKDLKYQERSDKMEMENKNKLSEFLNLNTRKNKLEQLNEIAEERKNKLERLNEISKSESSLFKKILKIFK